MSLTVNAISAQPISKNALTFGTIPEGDLLSQLAKQALDPSIEALIQKRNILEIMIKKALIKQSPLEVNLEKANKILKKVNELIASAGKTVGDSLIEAKQSTEKTIGTIKADIDKIKQSIENGESTRDAISATLAKFGLK